MMERIWIAISIIALVIAVVLGIYVHKKKKEERSLTMVGITLVVLGIIFGSDRLLSYGFMIAGTVLSAIDMIRNSRKKKK